MSRVWLKLPSAVRRWTMKATNARFTVTAAGLIFNDNGEVLLLRHFFRPGSGWGIPGGFIKLGEQPEQALRRELSEEIEFEVETASVFAVRSLDRPRQIEIVFLCRSNDAAKPRSLEVEEATWFRPESLPGGLPSDQMQLIQRAVADGANRLS